jgi:hypothetical protein
MRSSSSRLIRLLVVLATALSLLAAPLSVSATGGSGGAHAAFDITALTTDVSVGQPAAFDLFIRSDGRDAFNQTKIEGTAPGGTFVSAPAGCTGSGASVTCVLGKLYSGQTRTLRFVFLAPAAAGTLTFSAKLKNSGGYSYWSKPELKDSASTSVSDDPNFFGKWQPAHSSTLTYSTEPIGDDNGQSTNVSVPPVPVGYPVRLGEVDEPIVCSNGQTYAGFGDAVEMSIANGAAVEPHLTLTLTYEKSAIGYRDPWKIKFVHQLDDGSCQFPPRFCHHWNDGFCFDAWWTGWGYDKKLVIRVELPSNGRGKGI